MRFGYTGVSTVAQTLDQQNHALEAVGVSKIFSDTMSGARDDRPGLAALMDQLRAKFAAHVDSVARQLERAVLDRRVAEAVAEVEERPGCGRVRR
jgi:DNA invertase Pin-like site-specific DNA recombinase